MGVMETMLGLGIAGLLFGLIITGVSIGIFIFWILMIVDCIQRKFKEDSEKIIWILVLLFTGIVGALIYYFLVKSKGKKKRK